MVKKGRVGMFGYFLLGVGMFCYSLLGAGMFCHSLLGGGCTRGGPVIYGV